MKHGLKIDKRHKNITQDKAMESYSERHDKPPVSNMIYRNRMKKLKYLNAEWLQILHWPSSYCALTPSLLPLQ